MIDTGCAWSLPIYVSKHDVLTGDTARQIVIHNETFEEVCLPEKAR